VECAWICVQSPTFGRSRHTEEFVDANGVSWQMTKPQFTSLYANTVEQRKSAQGTRLLKIWTETRRTSDNELLAVHTLDFKLGNWFPSVPSQSIGVEILTEFSSEQVDSRAHSIPEIIPKKFDEEESSIGLPIDETTYVAIAGKTDPAIKVVPEQVRVDHLNEWQQISWQGRLGAGKNSTDENARIRSHYRVALLQWDVDDSYGHPIAEAGLNGLPLGKSALDELSSHLEESFKALKKQPNGMRSLNGQMTERSFLGLSIDVGLSCERH